MSLTKDHRLVEVAKQLCRKLRKNATKTEKIFWEAVRNKKFLNKKFYRQYPIFFDIYGEETFYIADFYCYEYKLVVEIDGKIHDYNKKHDEFRTCIMNDLSLDVLRFKNEEIENNLENVLIKLKEYFQEAANSTPD
ncbi:MAG: endonuclease domain-containing protein [Bacteroidota bacterium]|nr:endonuclease domain-containing protein [Bacteroidota bacterium]